MLKIMGKKIFTILHSKILSNVAKKKPWQNNDYVEFKNVPTDLVYGQIDGLGDFPLFIVSIDKHRETKTFVYSKTCVKRPLSKRPKIGFQDQYSLNAGQKYCRRGAFCNRFDLH